MEGEAEPVSTTTDAPAPDKTPPTDASVDASALEGWEELMGKDLLFKTLPLENPLDEDSFVRVQPQDTVVIDFVGRLASDPTVTDGPIFQEVTDWIIVIGEKDVVPALEMGARFLSVGETAIVWSHSKYGYGLGQRKHGDYELPPNANVRYQVTVKRIIPESERSTAAGQVRVALSKKTIGNDIYANEWYGEFGPKRAKQQYKRAAETMQYLLQTAKPEDDDIDDDILKQAEEIMLDSLNNIAALHLRAKEYKLAKEAATKVLVHDPNNFKALIRAAKAALLDPGSSYEEVDAAIKAAADNSNASDADVQRLRAEFRRRKNDYKEKSKAMFSKIGKSVGKTSEDQVNADSAVEANKESKLETSKPSKEEVMQQSILRSGEEAATDNAQADNAQEEGDSLLNWREWDWKNRILPYAFQLILPFIMFYIATIMKKREMNNTVPGSETQSDETEF